MSIVPCLLACLILHPTVFVFSVPVVYPAANQYIASNSMENLTYNCTVDTDYMVRWEINRTQYRSGMMPSTITSAGISLVIVSLDLNDRVSQISFSNVTRWSLSLQCVAASSTNFDAVKGVEHMVVSFDQPDVVSNLRLVPLKGDLILSWERPGNVPEAVPVLYTVIVNSTDASSTSMNITTGTSFSLRALEDQVRNNNPTGVCVMFEFAVSGSNDAGRGQPNTIIDTIPISPDVTRISKQLTVERVDLQPFSVWISFPPVNSCSVNFPLHNYTISVGDEVSHTLDADSVIVTPDGDRKVRLSLNSTILSGVALDESYPVTVTPCNEITCRTSEKVTLNTTDVQAVEVIYFRNRLFLRCSFADNSQARGCAVRLSLADGNDDEIYKWLRDNNTMPCFETNFRLDADVYSDTVIVVDIEEDGMLGSGNLTVLPVNINTTEEMFNNITGCPIIVSGMTVGPSSNRAAIIGGVLVPLLLIAIGATVIGIVVGILCVRRERKKKQELGLKTYEFSREVIKAQENKLSQEAPEAQESEFSQKVIGAQENVTKLSQEVPEAQESKLSQEAPEAQESKLSPEAQKAQESKLSPEAQKAQESIEFDASTETEPLITKACTYETRTGTITINMRVLAKDLNGQLMKQLKMKWD